MRTIVYMMHFRGRVSAVSNDSPFLRTVSSATSCTVTTTIGSFGLEGSLEPSQGGLAFLESELHVTGAASFEEHGTVCFGDEGEHLLHFSTIDHGRLTQTMAPGAVTGAASCNIVGGEGQLAAARGFIGSSFTLTDDGELEQFHSGLIFLPDIAASERKGHEEREVHIPGLRFVESNRNGQGVMAQTTTQTPPPQTLEAPRERWNAVLAEFTRENRGAHAALEVLGIDVGRFVETENRPFDGIAADLKDGEDTVWIYFGFGPRDRITHGIQNVTAIRIRPATGKSGAAVEIESADDAKTLLELSRPEDYELPPAEEGTRQSVKC